MLSLRSNSLFFFFNDTAPTEIYPLSLHAPLPISYTPTGYAGLINYYIKTSHSPAAWKWLVLDRKSTRLNSSHLGISYAVFCLKKKKKIKTVVHRISPARHTGKLSSVDVQLAVKLR